VKVLFILRIFYFFALAPNDRGYGHFGRVRKRSLAHSDKVNAGAKLPKCTSASQ